MQLPVQYYRVEEIANTITHAFGLLLSVIGVVLLLHSAFDQYETIRLLSYGVYGLSLVILFLASTLYHGAINLKAKQTYKLFDHCAIYLLIAGTYTPLLLITLSGPLGLLMLLVVWTLAIGGVLFKIIYGSKYKKISITSYLALGLISITCIQQIYNSISFSGFLLLCLGGAFYCVGTIFYVTKRIPFNHAIWHLFVLAGAISHFFMVWLYV